MSNKILCYSSQNSNRLQYVIHLIFVDILGYELFFTQDLSLFQESNLPKIYCSSQPISNDSIWLETDDLLFEKGFRKIDWVNEFQHFSILTKIFLLVTRYEEYNLDPSVLDAHGRFSAQKSISQQLGFLRKPIVNQWIIQFKNELLNEYPDLKSSNTPQYQVQLTYDIDQAWAFKNKGWVRNIGGFLKDILKGRFSTAFSRLSVIFSIKNDPEYTFDFMENIHKKLEGKILTPLHFWLLADHGEFDKNINWQNKPFQRLIRRIAKKHPVGIHPSYASNSDYEVLKTEINRLKTITTEGVHRSRQHYLKLSFPETYRRLLQAGISEDYSLGYSDDIGFRAGIASPFYWYDLENEQTTSLRLFPFQVMEVTLKEYLTLNPDEAIKVVKLLIDEIKNVHGTFTALWHNSTLSNVGDYEGWRRVYEETVHYSVEK